jgi:transposase
MVDKAQSLTLSQAKKDEYGEAGKYVSFTDGKGGKVLVSMNHAAVEKDLVVAGYNLIVTSETRMTDEDIYATYHNLWRIEESFRIMKSDLDARPAFVQKESTIKGHFLICYLSVLLERIFQFFVLDNKFGASEIFGFIKNFKVTKGEGNYINTTIDSDFITQFSEIAKLPLRNYYLTETQIRSILYYKP